MQRMKCRSSIFDEDEANACFNESAENFYDICTNRCIDKMKFTPLFHHFQLENYVYGNIFPILVTLVVLSSALITVVLSKKHMITPTNVVLKYMAIADTGVGLVPLPWTIFYHTLQYNLNEDQMELWWCYMYKYCMDAVPPVLHNIAMWLTILLASQRYICIEYPMESGALCCVRNVRIATILITVVSLLCGLPKLFDYYYEIYDGLAYFPNGKFKHVRRCVSDFTQLVRAIGPNSFFNSYFWIRALGFIILPCFLLIVLNFLLIRGLRKAQQRKSRLLRKKRAIDAQRQKDNNSTNLMLVVVVSIFLVVNLPQAVFIGLLSICTTFGIQLEFFDGIFPAAFLLVNNMLVMATYPVNFGIYCFMSSSFRATFKSIFFEGAPNSIQIGQLSSHKLLNSSVSRIECTRTNNRKSRACDHIYQDIVL